ncbi:integrase catalytic region [Corallococcus macrosporus]|uniref:Integrase catalytic region n=1 Tax=Myxococcus fulvus (strain ATCC BAA-855 / HW-1) TaxID=483219 RepID=F8C6A4_MYXFH|nr:integrase catalytic region [Corallococcus macrosporus]
MAAGQSIRHDNGRRYTSGAFQSELRFLEAESSPSFVRSPEGNGCTERFIRTPTGQSIRHDNGSRYTSGAFQSELRFLEAESSPSFVRSPEGNGCTERFIRTPKEQQLWGRTFSTVEELRRALLE